MIAALRGSLLWRDGSEICVEVAGVGYRVTVMPTTSVALGEAGDEVFVHVHHHVREDAEVLYGFATRDERVTFETLIGTHGVGPALAMAILGVHPPAALVQVVVDEDLAALCLVPGVGRKTGERLLVELKNRFDAELLSGAAGGGDAGTAGAAGLSGSAGTSGDAGGSAGSVRTDVRQALMSLGYSPDEVSAAIRDLPDDSDAGELLRVALQRLAVG